MANPTEKVIRDYLERMVQIRSTGGATDETSYYSALENLLNGIGHTLKPAVICNGQLRNQGAGHPDFGLYSRNQCSKGEPKPGEGEIPERGVVEVKPLSDNTWQTATGKQVTKYFDRYRLVLVTNYRDFLLVGEDARGRPAGAGAQHHHRIRGALAVMRRLAPSLDADYRGAREDGYSWPTS